MTKVLSWIATALGLVIRPCYNLTGNYALAILLFVLISKIILLPLSIWVQNNSIKLVKMQPEVNWLNVHHFGDAEYIAEEHAKINKKYRYNVWIGLIPILIQFVLLLGIVLLELHLRRISFNDNRFRGRRAEEIDLRNRQAEHGARVQRELA